MNYLAIDTSGKNLTVVLQYNGQTKDYFDDSCGVNHSVKIMPIIEEVKNNLNADFSKLDFIAVVVGAGSFTGIRIGVATAKALCFAYNIPCLSITSFDTIAYNKLSGKNLAVIDAKHDSFYVCGYNDMAICYNPSFIDKETLVNLSKEYNLLSFECIANFSVEVVSILDGLKIATQKKKDEKTCDLDLISPLYIRKSQAEENR